MRGLNGRSGGAIRTLLMSAIAMIACVSGGEAIERTSQSNTWEGAAHLVAADIGDDHGCVIRTDGKIFCWGNNTAGQLGLGSTSPSTEPSLALATQTASLVYPTSVAAGGNHSCAVDINGAAVCWGAGSSGQLGNGANSDQTSPVFFQIPSGREARTISAGFTFTCALLDDGRVVCSGANGSGQLGDGSTTSRNTPVFVQQTGGDLTGVVEITTGDGHACARTNLGAVWCWGAAFGSGSTSNLTVAAAVSLGTTVRSISASGTSTCAITTGGAVLCWGLNGSGQLGNGSTTDSATPVTVSGVSNAVSVGVGVNHACAVQANGAAYCWGDDSSGQLGNGSGAGSSSTATAVSLPSGTLALNILGGFRHGCALTSSGIECWGRDDEGQLGNGSTTTTTQQAPVVADLPPYSEQIAPFTWVNVASTFQRGRVLDVGGNHACALVPSGSHVNVGSSAQSTGGTTSRVTTTGIACWGLNTYGQLGTGNTTTQFRPRFTTGLSGAPLAVATGLEHSCALMAGGSVYCWGRNNYGQLGISTSTSSTSTPTQVSSISNAIAIAAGDDHTCTLLADGTVRCWGRADDGRLGDGEYVSGYAQVLPTGARATPVTVKRCSCTNDCVCDYSGITSSTTLVTADDFIAITAGGAHTCAVHASGTIWCWGRNVEGQSGRDGDNEIPLDYSSVRIAKKVTTNTSDSANLSSMVSVSAGAAHTCGLTYSGSTYCWGANANFQVQNSSTTSYRNAIDVSSRHAGAHAISAGGNTTCAMRNTSTAFSELHCWGQNDNLQAGAAGAGSLSTANQIMFSMTAGVLDLGVRVVAGRSFSCALTWEGDVLCWGSNDNGELGRGSSDGTQDFPQAAAVVDLR